MLGGQAAHMTGKPGSRPLAEFSREYAALEKRFCAQARSDRDIFLPGFAPSHPVEFLFVGMEPSLGTWARDDGDAVRQIKSGFRNFMYSLEDFSLHFSIRRFLCRESQSYHLTDISKGAMTTAKAQKNRADRYENWISLLQEEILLLTPSRIFSIGKNVSDTLKRHGLATELLLHYSRQAAGYRNQYVEGKELDFRRFANSINIRDIQQVVENVLLETNYPDPFAADVRKRIERAKLEDSLKKLLFGYKTIFERGA